MRYSSQIKPISYFKANAADVLTHLAENREPVIITQNGEAKAVLQDIALLRRNARNAGLAENSRLGQPGCGLWQTQARSRCRQPPSRQALRRLMTSARAKFEVLLTGSAEQNLEAIHDHIAEFDCLANADYVLDELMEVVKSLSKFPERSNIPKELAGLGIKEYRQAFFKPYRVIYPITSSQVIIYLIVDRRRGLQSVLAKRLLGA